jgi:hypothetical protein
MGNARVQQRQQRPEQRERPEPRSCDEPYGPVTCSAMC